MLYLRSRCHEEETRLAVYRCTTTWAVCRSEHFVIKFIPIFYNDTQYELQLRSLGQVTIIPQSSSQLTSADSQIETALHEVTETVVKNLNTLQIEVKVGQVPKEIIQVEGQPSDKFVKILAEVPPPLEATDDLCPVENMDLYIAERPILRWHDYGHIQSLNLINDEPESLRQALLEADIDPTYLIESPQQHPANFF